MANILTVFRLLLVPFFIYFLSRSSSGPSYVAGTIFVLAALTDWFDGFIARRTATITDFGKFFDPLADRLLVGSALIILLVQHRLPTWGLMAILLRDVFIMSGYIVLRQRGTQLSPNLLGKASTLVLMVALSFLLFGFPFAEWIFWLGVGLSLLSGSFYAARGVHQFRRPRAGVAPGR